MGDTRLKTVGTFAQLSDSTTQAPGVTTPVKITFNTNDEISGITHSESSNTEDIVIQEDGLYVIVPQPQFQKTSGGTNRFIDFWLRRNNIDVPNSNIRSTIKSNSETDVIVSHVVTATFKAGDILNIMMSVEVTGNGIGIYSTSPVGEPVIPSIIFSIHKN